MWGRMWRYQAKCDACGAVIQRPKRGGAALRCKGCKKQKDADEKRLQRAERSAWRDALASLPLSAFAAAPRWPNGAPVVAARVELAMLLADARRDGASPPERKGSGSWEGQGKGKRRILRQLPEGAE